MKKITLFMFSIIYLVMWSANILHAQEQPEYLGIYKRNPEDMAAVNKVITDFQTAIKTKDGALLSSLVMYDDIFFISPLPQDRLEEIRKRPGLEKVMLEHPTGRLSGFIKSISETEDALDEKFYNVNIKMDGNAALVTFDYEFIRNEKVQNYGFETWNMVKVDGLWKIATVFWTVNRLAETVQE